MTVLQLQKKYTLTLTPVLTSNQGGSCSSDGRESYSGVT